MNLFFLSGPVGDLILEGCLALGRTYDSSGLFFQLIHLCEDKSKALIDHCSIRKHEEIFSFCLPSTLQTGRRTRVHSMASLWPP